MDTPIRTPVEVEKLLRLTKYGTVDEIIEEIRKGHNLLNAEDASGRTIVHFAAYLGRWELLEAICSTFPTEVEVDHEDFDGNTPIVLAAKQRELRAVKTLVKHNASLSKRLKRNATVLHHAACIPDNILVLKYIAETIPEEISAIISDSEPGSPLHWACHSNCIVNLAFCLDEIGIPVDTLDYYGGSALFVAASLQHHDTLRFLLERGADITIKAKDGSTVISHIIEHDKPDVQCLKTLCQFDFEGFFACYDKSSVTDETLLYELSKRKLLPAELEEQAVRFKAQGDNSFHAKEFSKAIRFYTLAISYTPKNKVLFSNRSACYFNTGGYHKALADAVHCISLDDGWAKGYYRAAACYYELDSYKKCDFACSKGLVLDPSLGSLRQIQKDVKNRL
ncbi:ankyrin/TPR repeat protein [Perkinsela sp. CCAP 1560/4]|nr:ankyrin/TPR repeat protein [Perkinsela sp. CCAP 1560/4]|eukprot:KNH08135.1 ankyrin/TPR repeat protein [Perkinsela sp. CCAP 1560/4]